MKTAKKRNTSPWTRERFIKLAKKVHGDRYDYSPVVDVKRREDRVPIICPDHGPINVTVRYHLSSKTGCRQCGWLSTRLEPDEFIQKSREQHGDKYDYSKVKFIGVMSKITIICPIHGEFKQRAEAHLKGHGCSKCGNDSSRLTHEEYVSRAQYVHGKDRYIFTGKYTGINDRTLIECRKHGPFKGVPQEILRGTGCPKCKISKGELVISRILELNNIRHTTEVRLDRTTRYRYDIVLMANKIVIEYDGVHHYNPTNRHPEMNLKEIRSRDKIKDLLAKSLGYVVHRIKYTKLKKINKTIFKLLTKDYMYIKNGVLFKKESLLDEKYKIKNCWKEFNPINRIKIDDRIR